MRTTILGATLLLISAIGITAGHAEDHHWQNTLNDQVAAVGDKLQSYAPAGTDFASNHGFVALRSKKVFDTGFDFGIGAQTGTSIDAPGMNRFTKPHEPTIPMLKLEWNR